MAGIEAISPGKAFGLDHRIPRSRGGPTVAANLWLLCDDCHLDKTRRECARP